MDAKKEFYRIMEEQTEMALATSVNDSPNVRAVNFYFDEKSRILYFSTFVDRNKIEEIKKNPKIAFTTIPKLKNEFVKASGICVKSKKTVYDLKDEFSSKILGYADIIKEMGDLLVLFEISFEKAFVRINSDEFEDISFI